MKPYFEYLPPDASSPALGLSVRGGGYTRVSPKTSDSRSEHPNPYYFWERGRKLENFQLTFLSRGKGQFESRQTGPQTITAGTFVILFPGIWHRYRPDFDTGWDEHWVEVKGTLPEQWRANTPNFNPNRSILSHAAIPEALALFKLFHQVLRAKAPGHRSFLSGISVALFSQVLGNLTDPGPQSDLEIAIQRAQQRLSGSPGAPFKLEPFLKSFSLSQAHFRKQFKISTGMTIKEYQSSIRLAHAQNFLLHSNYTIKEIAAKLGFHSQFHFSSFFSAHRGMPPSCFQRGKDDQPETSLNRP